MWINQFIFTKNSYNYITMYSLFNILILMIYNIDFILFLHYTDSIFLRFLHKEGLMMIGDNDSISVIENSEKIVNTKLIES